MTSITLLLILAATLALSWAGTGLIIRHAVRWGLEDVPNARSSHTRITPRGGGAAIVAASLAGALLLALAAFALPRLLDAPDPYQASLTQAPAASAASGPVTGAPTTGTAPAGTASSGAMSAGTGTAAAPSWWALMLHQDMGWLRGISGLGGLAVILFTPAFVLGLLGLQDDRRGLSIKLRLGFQLFSVAWLLGSAFVLIGGMGNLWFLVEQLWQVLGRLGMPGMSLPLGQAFASGHSFLPLLLTGLVFTALLLAGVWWINLYNFMDGIDGIAASQALFMLLGAVLLRSLSFVSALGTVPDTAPLHCSPNGPAGQLFATDGLLACLHLENLMTDPFSTASLIVAAAVAGFLMWNWAPARIFMGDAGSLFLGNIILILAVIEAMIWLGETQQQLTRPVNPDGVAHVIHGVPPASWFILGALFITDATVTLMRRILSGQRPGDPHRSHLYQRLARRFGSHARVTLVYCLINVFWLLPLAALARLLPGAGMSMVLLAYVPLVLLAWLLGAGRPEPAGT